jgi:hypothetical protein
MDSLKMEIGKDHYTDPVVPRGKIGTCWEPDMPLKVATHKTKIPQCDILFKFYSNSRIYPTIS